MDLLAHPLATMEFLALDTETNGLGGPSCELTEVGAVLVGGGELHDSWSSLMATNLPLGRGIQRFTGITQADIDGAPDPAGVLEELASRLQGRVLVAHNAAFDVRVLRQGFQRAGLSWPEPPALCTVQLARRLMPVNATAPSRKLAILADTLGIEVAGVHRALTDAETCARIFCALFTRLCGAAATVADAVALCGPGQGTRARRAPRPRRVQPALAARERPTLDFSELPRDPGVYIFRDAQGDPLYVGKSVSIRSRARAHFAPSTLRAAWTQHAEVVDYRATASELGALVTENRLIKELSPPGNVRLAGGSRRDGDLVYLRCRFDVAYPVLEVADAPAAGLAINIGPLRGRDWVEELVDQLESLHGLRHCGRRLQRRQHPSVYGQMGRCLSPCLGDLDPNLYRSRLDRALAPFLGERGAQEALLAAIDERMREAATAQQYERAAVLRRRRARCAVILARLEGRLQAAHARPLLLLAPHPTSVRFDAFWVAAGRLLDFGEIETEAPDEADLLHRTERVLARAGRSGTAAHVPPDELDEITIVTTYLASHPELPQLGLDPAPTGAELAAFIARARLSAAAPAPARARARRQASVPAQAKGRATTSTATPSLVSTRVPGGASRRTRARPIDPQRGDAAALVTVATERPSHSS